MQHPSLWQAVRNPHSSDEFARQSPADALVEQLYCVMMKVFREERTRGDIPGQLFDEAAAKHLLHGIAISLDGRTVPGMQIETDSHVLGIASGLGRDGREQQSPSPKGAMRGLIFSRGASRLFRERNCAVTSMAL